MDTDVLPRRSLEGHMYRMNGIDHVSSWMWRYPMNKRNQYEEFIRDVLAETNDKEFHRVGMKKMAKEF